MGRDDERLSEKVNAISAEETELARLRAGNREEVGDAVILPQPISVEPVSAVARSGDLSWLALLNATISLLIEADYLGISSDNVDAMKSSTDPEIRYLLGVTPGIGIPVGLDDCWAERVVKAVGSSGQRLSVTSARVLLWPSRPDLMICGVVVVCSVLVRFGDMSGLIRAGK